MAKRVGSHQGTSLHLFTMDHASAGGDHAGHLADSHDLLPLDLVRSHRLAEGSVRGPSRLDFPPAGQSLDGLSRSENPVHRVPTRFFGDREKLVQRRICPQLAGHVGVAVRFARVVQSTKVRRESRGRFAPRGTARLDHPIAAVVVPHSGADHIRIFALVWLRPVETQLVFPSFTGICRPGAGVEPTGCPWP